MGKEKVQGYPLEIFTGTVPQKYICEECKDILRIPVQGVCGHRFCHSCVEKICKAFPNGTLCPACLNSGEEVPENLSAKLIAPDHAIRRQLEKVNVHCCNTNCDWAGTLKQYESHEVACPHRTIVCKCGEIVPADRLPLHLAHSCPASQSSSPMNSLKLNAGNDEDVLVRVKWLETQVALGNISERTALSIKQLEDKLNAMELSLRTQGGFASSMGANATYATMTDLDQYKQIMKVIASKVTAFEALSSVLNNQIQVVVTQISALDDKMREVQEKQTRSDSKLRNFEKMLALHDIRLGELEEKINNVDQYTSYTGVFYWKIDRWKKRMEDAKERRTTSLYSPSFYTGRFGYKMCMRLYPMGDGMGKDSHVSLFFVIMKGPYDALLRWPFVHKVTLTMLDQTNPAGDSFDSFTPDPNSSSFQKPVNEMNVASGCPRFYDIERLEMNSDRFLVNDTMFIKVVIDTSEIVKR